MEQSDFLEQQRLAKRVRRANLTLVVLALLVCILTFCACLAKRKPALPPLPSYYRAATLAALERSGTNRPELIRALAGIRRDRLPAMCSIISRMPQYDLSNATADMLIDHVNSTFDILGKVPWKTPDTNSQVFLDYVLPHRVFCESLENSRRILGEIVLSGTRDCHTPSEAVERIMWLGSDPFIAKHVRPIPPNPLVAPDPNAQPGINIAPGKIGSAFPYDYPPLAGWKYNYQYAGYRCRTRQSLYVAMLRSVGIPACVTDRLASATTGATHGSLMWYDVTTSTWHVHQPDRRVGDAASLLDIKNDGEVMIYAMPPYMAGDYVGKHQFEKLTPIVTFSYPHATLTVRARMRGLPVADAVVGVYVFAYSTQNWCNVVTAKTDKGGRAVLNLGYNDQFRPYMISASKGEFSALGFVTLSPFNGPATIDLTLAPNLSTFPETAAIDVRATKAR